MPVHGEGFGGSHAWLPVTAHTRLQHREDFSALQPLETQSPLLKARGGKPAESREPRRFIFVTASKRDSLRVS